MSPKWLGPFKVEKKFGCKNGSNKILVTQLQPLQTTERVENEEAFQTAVLTTLVYDEDGNKLIVIENSSKVVAISI